MARKRILVVDDEASLTRMLRKNLEATGKYEVQEENRGAHAAAAAREFRPDLILLDVMMPDVDGGSVAAQIESDDTLKQTPIVFLTAIVEKGEVEPAGGIFGGHTFLAKPVAFSDLVVCIENHLGK